jgi:hypothetical protein
MVSSRHGRHGDIAELLNVIPIAQISASGPASATGKTWKTGGRVDGSTGCGAAAQRSTARSPTQRGIQVTRGSAPGVGHQLEPHRVRELTVLFAETHASLILHRTRCVGMIS